MEKALKKNEIKKQMRFKESEKKRTEKINL
jgi:hypothetical protein